ncbi:hypothetical protein CBL_09629 [Carabus blaptoides fortunei]
MDRNSMGQSMSCDSPKDGECCTKYRPGKITRNPFLNFLREYRKQCCSDSILQVAIDGAKEWNNMTAAEREPYIQQAMCAPKRKMKESLAVDLAVGAERCAGEAGVPEGKGAEVAEGKAVAAKSAEAKVANAGVPPEGRESVAAKAVVGACVESVKAAPERNDAVPDVDAEPGQLFDPTKFR